LTVRNGIAQYWGGSLDFFQGDVSPQVISECRTCSLTS
jgi:hypothetical protein